MPRVFHFDEASLLQNGGHALAILPGLTHYNIGNSPLLAAATLAFLEEQPA